ncbi:response regulator [Geobacter pickeringii]|uniref:Uncharacterized protein n=1 Tax=Geobacter pickeringii TaxID=345632 RepID=A0A0B5BDL3_9BACT|nr:hypothetical protein [Geobacter pickeringii]AJE03229.1 hypothetical protein GPICK_07545 [Geobacter pickeringii]
MRTDDTTVIPMLLVDDNRRYAEALFRDARRHGIVIHHALSLEEAREVFEGPAGSSLAGLILDVKCHKEKNQPVPDNSFIVAAVKYFGAKAPHMPMAAITGESGLYGSIAELFAGTLTIYSKGRDEDEMLATLAAQARNTDRVKLQAAYRDAFSVCSRFLGREAEEELLNCLAARESDDFTVIKNTLGCVRRLQEKIYLALNRLDESLVPTAFVQGEVNVISAYKHLTEKGVVERYRIIDRFAELVYKISSDNGAHTPYASLKYPPTRYTVQAVIFALLDLLHWFGSLMESRGAGSSR